MCRLFFFLEDVSSSQNSLILCLIGIDRFLAVVGLKRSTKVCWQCHQNHVTKFVSPTNTDSYIVIPYTKKEIKRLPNIQFLILGAWMVAFGTSLPTYFAVDRFEFPVKYNPTANTTEIQIQSICGPIDERMGKIRIIKCIFLFFVPLIIMSYCYAAGNWLRYLATKWR